jgi:hypothetical protein
MRIAPDLLHVVDLAVAPWAMGNAFAEVAYRAKICMRAC